MDNVHMTFICSASEWIKSRIAWAICWKPPPPSHEPQAKFKCLTMFCQSAGADSFSMQCTFRIWFRKLDLNAKDAPDDFNVFVWSQPLQFFFQVFIEILWFYVHFMQKMKNRVKKTTEKKKWTVSSSDRGRSWKILSLWTVDMDTHSNWHAHANLSPIGKKPADSTTAAIL